MNAGDRARAAYAAAFGVFVIAFFLRLLALPNGGPPHDFVPDEHVVGRALTMLQERDPFPSGGRETSYPHGMAWVLAPFYAANYFFRDRALFPDAASFEFVALLHPFAFFQLARLLSAFFGAWAVLAAFHLARRLGASGGGALVAGALIAFSPLQLLLASQARPWALLVLLMLYACERAARCLEEPPRGLFGAAFFAAAAAAVHPVGFATWIPLAAAVFASRGHRIRNAIAVGGAAMFTASAYPGLLFGEAVRPTAYEGAPIAVGGQGLFLRFDGSRFAELLQAWSSSEVLLVGVVALALLALVLRRRNSEGPPRAGRAGRVLVAGLAAALGLAFLLYFGSLPRYLLPTGALLGTVAAVWLFPRGASPPSRAAVVLVGVLLFASAATCLRLASVLAAKDTRVEARQAMQKGSARRRFAIEAGGPPVDFAFPSLVRLERFDPGGLSRRESARLSRRSFRLKRIKQVAGIALERVFRTRALKQWQPGYAALWSREGRPEPEDPAQRLELTFWGEAITEVVLAQRFDHDRSAALEDWLLRKECALQQTFDPGTADARLPGEVRDGWWTYWTVQRPGPRVEWWSRP